MSVHKEWYPAAELIGLSQLPSTKRGISIKAKNEGWKYRDESGNGGLRREYHISSLPNLAKAALLKRQSKKQPSEAARNAVWAGFDKKPEQAKTEANRRLCAIETALTLVSQGTPKTTAWELAAEQFQSNAKTLRRWHASCKKYPRADWLAYLAPNYTGRTKTAECSAQAWEYFKQDYLRLEKPALSACYYRLERIAAERGWEIPSMRTLNRWIETRIPVEQRVLLREGEHALRLMFPSQQRTVVDLHALQWINGDGYKHNVFVKWPDGTIERPKTWVWQDVYSRKILAYRVDRTENSDMLRLSFGDVVDLYGIPEHVTIDNTRAAANKWMSGGVRTRYRFKIKDDDPWGIFKTLGMQVHWTSVHGGKGWGQAKPVERCFSHGGLGEVVDKHPILQGAYTGPNTLEKPENYGNKATDLITFLKVLNAEIIAWNARDKRRTEICQGVFSFDQAFDESYAQSPIQKATEQQRRLWLLAAEAVPVKPDGTFTLDAGSKAGEGRNRYYSPDLTELGRKKVVVRFDPQDLHEEVFVYTLDNKFVTRATIIEATGFGDTESGREWNRKRTQFVKATKAAAKAIDEMENISTMKFAIPPELPGPAAAKVVKPIRTAVERPADKALADRLNKESKQGFALLQVLDKAKASESMGNAEEKYQKWLLLNQKSKEGGELTEREKVFLTGFPTTSEYKAQQMLAELRGETKQQVG